MTQGQCPLFPEDLVNGQIWSILSPYLVYMVISIRFDGVNWRRQAEAEQRVLEFTQGH